MESLDGCPVCKNEDTKFFFSAPDRLHGVPGEFRYCVCNSCATVFQNPMVVGDDISLCYPGDYYTHSLDVSELEDVAIYERLKNQDGSIRNRARDAVIGAMQGKKRRGFLGAVGFLLSKFRSIRERAFFGILLDEFLPVQSEPRKALEIGSGSGELLKSLRSVGWIAEGIEWDEIAAKVAERQSGCPVRVGDIFDLELGDETYDLIVLHHVFEHLRDPVRFLKEFRRLLTPGGKVVLVYPNPYSLGTKFYRTFWFPWDPPRHLTFPSLHALGKVSADLGYQLTTRTTGRTGKYCSAKSRLYRNKKKITEQVFPDTWDSMFEYAENISIFFGLSVGDEIISVLRKENPRGA